MCSISSLLLLQSTAAAPYFGRGISPPDCWLFQCHRATARCSSELGKLSNGHRNGMSVCIPIPKRGNAKECSNYCTIALTSHAHKACIYIFISSLPCDCSILNIKNYFISMILNQKHIVLFSGNFF